MSDDFKLDILKTAGNINYTKPERTNKLVPAKKYDEIDDTVESNVAVTNAGTTIVNEEALSKLLGESKKDTRYITDNKIPDSDKVEINGKKYIKAPAVIKENLSRYEEHPNAEKRATNLYSATTLKNIMESSDVKAQKGDFEDYAQKQEKQLGDKRIKQYGITCDEVTGAPLNQTKDFHHKNKKTIHTDPEQRLDPNKGVIVNQDTHRKIHKQNINDEKQLNDYMKNNSSDSD